MRHGTPTLLALIALMWYASSATAGTTPSRTQADSSPSITASQVVSERLAQLGLSQHEIKERLSLLSSNDVQHLSTNIGQLQTAGMSRTTKWIVIGVVVIVVVIWAIDQAGSPYGW